jgi:hypothetical protein
LSKDESGLNKKKIHSSNYLDSMFKFLRLETQLANE